MGKKSISIMVVPHTEAHVYNFRIPLTFLYSAGISLVILLIALSLLVIDYSRVKREISSLAPLNNQLAQKNERLEEERGSQAHEIQKLNKIMMRLKKFYDKLRIMTGLEVHEEKLSSDGKGGPDVSDETWRDFRDDVVQAFSDSDSDKKYLNDVNSLKEKVLIRYQSFNELESYLDSQKSLLSSTPSIWPIQGWIKQEFGRYVSPFTGYEEQYNGVDIVARMGTPVSSTADGRVTFSGKDGDYGYKVVISHGNGYQTIYAHNYVNKVRAGERVKRGQVIATCGNSGRNIWEKGPHLYYAVKVNGKYVDPMTYMLN